ncbi:MAG: hypothetical protein IJU48_07880 [Synergistaceae bacterium]|nr:hypothetical protein [Synergistaceae bacterium]
MIQDSFTLTFPHEKFYASRNNFAPESLLVSALVYSLAVSISSNFIPLILVLILPVMIVCVKKFQVSSLLKLNIINLVMIITLALTWPVFLDGVKMGMLITLRLNMIYIVCEYMIFPLGITGIYEALYALRVPEKLRVLIILTLRGIFIMRERLETALISVKLRAPNLKGIMKLKVFASILASVLLQSSSHSERMMQAVILRGGFTGFSQSEREGLKLGDMLLIVSFMLYAAVVMKCNYI